MLKLMLLTLCFCKGCRSYCFILVASVNTASYPAIATIAYAFAIDVTALVAAASAAIVTAHIFNLSFTSPLCLSIYLSIPYSSSRLSLSLPLFSSPSLVIPRRTRARISIGHRPSHKFLAISRHNILVSAIHYDRD
jgi:hypothetical protein